MGSEEDALHGFAREHRRGMTEQGFDVGRWQRLARLLRLIRRQ